MDHLPSLKVGEVPSVFPIPPSVNPTISRIITPHLEISGSVSPRKQISIVVENTPVSDPQQRPYSGMSISLQIPALIKELLSLGPTEQQNNSADTTSPAHPPPEATSASPVETEERSSLTSHIELPIQPLGGLNNPSKTIAESPHPPTRESATLSNEPEEQTRSELKTMPPKPLLHFAQPTTILETVSNSPTNPPKNKIHIKLNNKSGILKFKPSPIRSILGEEIDATVLPSTEDLTAAARQLNGLERGTSRPVSSPSASFDTANLFGKASEKRGGTMSDGLCLPGKEELDDYGCTVCGPQASCIIHEAYDEADINRIARRETIENLCHMPGREIARIEASIEIAEYEKKQIPWNVADRGPFCCTNVKHDERASAVGLPDEKKEQIKAFMTLPDKKKETNIMFCTKEYSQEQMRAIKQVIKVNPVKNFEEQSTYLFALADANSKENGIHYHGFLYIETVQEFAKHGDNAYLAYFCRKHNMNYRVGFHVVKWSKDEKMWATTGDARMDRAMQLPVKQNFSPLGYPRMGFEHKKRVH